MIEQGGGAIRCERADEGEGAGEGLTREAGYALTWQKDKHNGRQEKNDQDKYCHKTKEDKDKDKTITKTRQDKGKNALTHLRISSAFGSLVLFSPLSLLSKAFGIDVDRKDKERRRGYGWDWD